METPLIILLVLTVICLIAVIVSLTILVAESHYDGKIKSPRLFMVIFLASVFLFFATAASVVELNKYVKADKGKCPQYMEIKAYIPR